MPVVLLSLFRFLVALVQMAGLLAYFHQYLGWGLPASAITGLLLTLLVPIAATVFGFLGALQAWAWPWWLALLVFLPGLVMALMAVAGVGVLGALSAVLLRRRRPTRPAENANGLSDAIEGEVISSRVDGDGPERGVR